MIAPLATVVQVLVAGVLLVAATAKAATPRAVTTTIGALGLPSPSVLAALLVATELTASIALVLAPSAAPTVALVLGLGLVFAGAGAWAWRTGTGVACACFGGGTERTLGLGQVIALPLWIVAGIGPAAGGAELAGADGVVALTTIAVGLGAVLSAMTLRRARTTPILAAVS